LAWSRSFVPWLKHSFVQFNARHIKRHISRRKKQSRTARPRCLVDRALHRWAELAIQQHSALQLHLRRPPRHTVYMRLPSAPLGKAQWHLPILTTEPRPASQLNLHEITLNKYCYCWSSVVVIPNNSAAISFKYIYYGDYMLQLFLTIFRSTYRNIR